MAPPGNRLRAHDGGTFRSCELDEVRKRRIEFRSLHVVRVSAKAVVAPSCIDGMLFGVTQTAELLSVRVSDMSLTQRILERIRTELRITPRARNRPDIDDAFHSVRFEQCEEFIERPRGVADSQNYIAGGRDFRFGRKFGFHVSFLRRRARFCRSP